MTDLRAVYYPFSRTISETTLKRAMLLYDELLFVDPVSARVRDGLYDAGQHSPYLPGNAATFLEQEWEQIRDRYGLLQREGLVRLVDPVPLVEGPGVGDLLARTLAADLADVKVRAFFDGTHPRTWSMLRSRIPPAAFRHLAHNTTSRLLSAPTSGADGPVAYFMDGRPGATPGRRPERTDDGREYAALLPYFAGSSLATSTAMVVAVEHDAVPLTDSDAHSRLLSLHLARAAAAIPSLEDMPGLHARPAPSAAQQTALVHQRVVDSVVSHEDLAALSLEDCLRYREATMKEREQFREFLRDVVRIARAEPWSPETEALIADRIAAAKNETSQHAASMRAAYRSLFKRSIAGLSVTAAPALLATVFPVVSPLAVLLFGGGQLTGLLSGPVKELLDLWATRDRSKSSLAYLMELPSA